MAVSDFSWILKSIEKSNPCDIYFVVLGDHGKTFFMISMNIGEISLEDILESMKWDFKEIRLLEEKLREEIKDIRSVEDFLDYLKRREPILLASSRIFRRDQGDIYIYPRNFIEKVPRRKDVEELKERFVEDIIAFLKSISFGKSPKVEIYSVYPRPSREETYKVPINFVVIPFEFLLREINLKKFIAKSDGVILFIPPRLVYPQSAEEFRGIARMLDPGYRLKRAPAEMVAFYRALEILRKYKREILLVIPRYDRIYDMRQKPYVESSYALEIGMLDFIDKNYREGMTLEDFIKEVFGEEYLDKEILEETPDPLESIKRYIERFVIKRIETCLGKELRVIRTSAFDKETHYEFFREILRMIAKNKKAWRSFCEYLQSVFVT